MSKVVSIRPNVILCAVLGATAAFTGNVRGADFGGGTIEAHVSGRVDYDSNIYLNNSDVSDTVMTGTASVHYARDVALVAERLSAGVTGTDFSKYSGQNSIDPFASATLTYTPSDKTVLNGDLSYTRSTLANEALNARTKSDEINASGSMQNLFSEKLGYRVTGSYRDSNYLTSGYADVHSYSLGLSGVYVYSPKLTTLLGYTHRESWNSHTAGLANRNPASKDERVDVGFEGALLPKINGTLHVGWQERNFEANVFDNTSDLFLAAGLKWIPRQKTTVSIDASRDFDVTAARQSVLATTFSVGVTQVLNERWSADASAALTNSKYTGSVAALNRSDDNYRLKARLSYSITNNVSADAALGYSNVDSTNIFSTYDRVNAGVGITATF